MWEKIIKQYVVAAAAAAAATDKPALVPGFHRPTLKLRGLGLEGESAATEVLLHCTRERPPSIDQLLTASKPAGLVMLVSLGESCEWIADNLEKWAAAAAAMTGMQSTKKAQLFLF